MGTALTEVQAREISRITENLYVCYDGDGAGRHASVKNVDILSQYIQNVKVVSLDDGKDPDETVRDEGYEGFMKHVSEALPVVEYKLKLCADANDLGSVNGRAKYVQSALKVLKGIDNKAEREVYMAVVSKLSKVSVSTLTAEIGTVRPKREEPVKENVEEKQAKNLRASRFIVNRLLNNEVYTDLGKVKREWLANDTHKKIFDFVLSEPEKQASISKMYDVLGYDDEEVNCVLGINLHFSDKGREADYYNDCLLALANESISQKLDEEKERFNTLSDSAEKKACLVEISALTKKLKSKSIEDKL